MHRSYRFAISTIALGIVAACSGAQEQDVLSKQIGSATTSTSGASGQSSGDGSSGQTTSGEPTTSSGGPTTSSGAPAGDCQGEGDSDSTQRSPIVLGPNGGCAKGTLHLAAIERNADEEDWVRYVRPKGSRISFHFSGTVSITVYDEQGRPHDLDHVPNNEGTYNVQIQYDVVNHPLSGDQLALNPSFDWSFSVGFN